MRSNQSQDVMKARALRAALLLGEPLLRSATADMGDPGTPRGAATPGLTPSHGGHTLATPAGHVP
jgi:hypothetical protein